MKNKVLFLGIALLVLLPWAFILKFVGVKAQFVGLCVQMVGAGCFICKRKQIFH